MIRRYHNVFYAYRGQAPGDPLLNGPRQLENNVTRALVVTLQHAGADVTARFVRELADVRHTATEFTHDLEVPYRDSSGPRVVLLGLSPDGRIEANSIGDPAGSSRVDALIDAPGEVRVLLESKIVGGCDGDQLWRHARAWGQREPVRQGATWRLPENWVQRRWADVHAFGSRDSTRPDVEPVGRFLLGQLAEYLELCGLAGQEQRARAVRRDTITLDDGRDGILSMLGAAPNGDAIHEICDRLYGGPARPYYVGGEDCRADSARVAQAYSSDGAQSRRELLDSRGEPANVITARRALSILYGPDDYAKTVAPASPTAGAPGSI
jgi:hypothetical protein